MQILAIVDIPEDRLEVIRQRIAQEFGVKTERVKVEDKGGVLPVEKDLNFDSRKIVRIKATIKYPAAEAVLCVLLRPQEGCSIDGTEKVKHEFTRLLPGEQPPPPLRMAR